MMISTVAAAAELADWLDAFQVEILGRLLLATLLGGVIGLERELSGKPAGLRTNILICVGATLLMEVSIVTAGLAGPGQSADPSRIAAQVVSGIGFIGAGTILVARGHVVGLTTAATLWVVAAIGLATGARAYVLAVGATGLVFLTLVFLRRIEDWALRRRPSATFLLSLEPDPDVLRRVETLFAAAGLKATPVRIEKGKEEYRVSYDVVGPARGRDASLQRLTADPGVRDVRVE
jgi:putative Mg2+ transporter-C (MgtC) family protein